VGGRTGPVVSIYGDKNRAAGGGVEGEAYEVGFELSLAHLCRDGRRSRCVVDYLNDRGICVPSVSQACSTWPANKAHTIILVSIRVL
jgi:hypothetical protein